MKETLWKNHFNFVKVVPIKYVNFIATVITVSEKMKLFLVPTLLLECYLRQLTIGVSSEIDYHILAKFLYRSFRVLSIINSRHSTNQNAQNVSTDIVSYCTFPCNSICKKPSSGDQSKSITPPPKKTNFYTFY